MSKWILVYPVNDGDPLQSCSMTWTDERIYEREKEWESVRKWIYPVTRAVILSLFNQVCVQIKEYETEKEWKSVSKWINPVNHSYNLIHDCSSEQITKCEEKKKKKAENK